MTTTAERLREALNLRGMKQSELAAITGIGKSSISTYLSGEYLPKQRNVYKMAQALDVNEAWLMGIDAPMARSTEDILSDAAVDTVYNQEFNALTKEEKERALNSVRTLPQNLSPLPSFVKKPRLGAIACGKPILAVEEADEFDDVPDTIECDFTLLCKGDSMTSARIFDGDIVYIRAQPQVENGEIAAVRIGDEATLKRVYYTPNSDRVTLRAANPLYTDMEFEGPALDDIEILGKAVAFTSMIK